MVTMYAFLIYFVVLWFKQTLYVPLYPSIPDSRLMPRLPRVKSKYMMSFSKEIMYAIRQFLLVLSNSDNSKQLWVIDGTNSLRDRVGAE